jgi:hypothetical protein
MQSTCRSGYENQGIVDEEEEEQSLDWYHLDGAEPSIQGVQDIHSILGIVPRVGRIQLPKSAISPQRVSEL